MGEKKKFQVARKILASVSIATIMFSTVAPLISYASPALQAEQSIQSTANFGAGQGIQWPDHVYAPFVDFGDWAPEDGYGGAPSLVKLSQNQGAMYYNIGFIQATGGVAPDGSLNWGFAGFPALSEGQNNAQYNGMKKSIKDFRDIGGDVTVSFGGATGTAFWMETQDVDTLVNTYVKIIEGFGLTSIDLDIEGSGENLEANKANAEAIKQVQDITGVEVSLTFPVLPTGLTATGYANMKAYYDAGVDVKYVNLMTMCFGENAAPDGYAKGATDAVDSVAVQIQQVVKETTGEDITLEEAYGYIGTTPSIGFEGSNHPIFTESDMQIVIDHAIAHNVGQVSFWVANRDAQIGGYKTNPGINEPYAFGHIGREFPDSNDAPDEKPGQVQNVKVSQISPVSAVVSFDALPTKVKEYEIYVNGSLVKTTNKAGEVVLEGLTPDTVYTVEVVAISQGDIKGDASDAVTFRTETPDTIAPSKVQNINTTNVSTTSMDITFDAATDNYGVKEYEVKIDGRTLITQKNSVTVQNLSPNNTYDVIITAIDYSGNRSEPSVSQVSTLSANAWNPTTVYSTPNTVVLYEDNLYSNNYWIDAGVKPDKDDRQGAVTGWKMIGGVDFDSIPNYNPSIGYAKGSQVIYNGKIYEATYWANPGDKPGEAPMWKYIGDVEIDETVDFSVKSDDIQGMTIGTENKDAITLNDGSIASSNSAIKVINNDGIEKKIVVKSEYFGAKPDKVQEITIPAQKSGTITEIPLDTSIPGKFSVTNAYDLNQEVIFNQVTEVKNNSLGIASAEEFLLMGSIIESDSNVNFHLVKDIDFTNIPNATISSEFSGTFDGQGHVIENWNSNKGGLFRLLSGTVENVYLKDAIIVTDNIEMAAGLDANYGSIANNSTGNVTIKNVGVSNLLLNDQSIVPGYQAVGGLIGRTEDCELVVTNSYVTGLITDTSYDHASIGGLVGAINGYSGSTTIKNSYSQAKLNVYEKYGVTQNVGGLVGWHTWGELNINNSYYEGSMDLVYSDYIGGLVGQSFTTVNIKNSYADVSEITGNGFYRLQNGLIGYGKGNVYADWTYYYMPTDSDAGNLVAGSNYTKLSGNQKANANLKNDILREQNYTLAKNDSSPKVLSTDGKELRFQ